MKDLKEALTLLVVTLSCAMTSSCGKHTIQTSTYEAILTLTTTDATIDSTSPPQSKTAATQVAPQTYSKIFELEIAEYQVSKEDDYEIITVPGGRLEINAGCPILPFVEVGTLVLPYGASIINLGVIDSESSSIGRYNIPIADIAPFSEGGISYRDDTDIDYFYPPEIVFSESTSTGPLIRASPIQHNPDTDETVFYSYVKIQATYTAQIPVAIVAFSTDKSSYTPGDIINTSTIVENVGSDEISLRGTLTLKDEFGQIVGSQESEWFSILPGQSHTLSLSWEERLEGGTYDVIITIVDVEENVIGAASQSIQVW